MITEGTEAVTDSWNAALQDGDLRARLSWISSTLCSPVVSVFLPARPHVEARESRLELRGLTADALRLADHRDMGSVRIRGLLAPLETLSDDEEFWLAHAGGLALFSAPGGFLYFRIPELKERLAFVGERLLVRPILPMLTRGHRFLVLSLSRNRVRLLECTRTTSRELELRDTPKCLSAALGDDWEERSLQLHTGGPHAGYSRGRATFHAQGGAADDGKEETERFLRLVDEGVRRTLGKRDLPLVVAAVDRLSVMYRRVSTYPALMEGGLPGCPDHLSADELRARASEWVEPRLEGLDREKTVRLLEEVDGEHLAAGLEEALSAAADGRVSTLIVDPTWAIWGAFDGSKSSIQIHETREPGDVDLLDLSVHHALDTGAQVRLMPAEALPGGHPVVGLLRF